MSAYFLFTDIKQEIIFKGHVFDYQVGEIYDGFMPLYYIAYTYVESERMYMEASLIIQFLAERVFLIFISLMFLKGIKQSVIITGYEENQYKFF